MLVSDIVPLVKALHAEIQKLEQPKRPKLKRKTSAINTARIKDPKQHTFAKQLSNGPLLQTDNKENKSPSTNVSVVREKKENADFHNQERKYEALVNRLSRELEEERLDHHQTREQLEQVRETLADTERQLKTVQGRVQYLEQQASQHKTELLQENAPLFTVPKTQNSLRLPPPICVEQQVEEKEMTNSFPTSHYPISWNGDEDMQPILPENPRPAAASAFVNEDTHKFISQVQERLKAAQRRLNRNTITA